ncbi:hypothetical protein CK203_084943 [Vitis vinifera]|uniref:Uncharacterized protein n=2 Tax=Vitis vinifera TaxID=29760 RepID=A0A438CXG1_VITVI|nr:hypothetical protein CK203_084943 [Vitis vinifera]
MVLFLSQPELSVGVFQGMLQGILGKRKAKRPNKPYGTEWRRVKILACRNCRTPFSSTSTHPIQKVNGLDGEPYPNCYHVKEGANLEIQGPRSFHTAHLSNGKSILLLRVVCIPCRVLAGFQVFHVDRNNDEDLYTDWNSDEDTDWKDEDAYYWSSDEDTYWSSDTEDTDWSSDSSSDTEETYWSSDEDIHLDVGHFILNAV